MKILSIGFHQGALHCIENMLSSYAVTSETLSIDPNGYHYNMTHDRADMLWKAHKDYYNQFDVIITSDTAPLSRIFLQGGYRGNLIIYVCNRIDYKDGHISEFPDKEYYDLLRASMGNPKVALIGYTPYEQVYCNRLGIYLEDIIKPALEPTNRYTTKQGYYIPEYQNNQTFNLREKCIGMDVLTGRHSGLSHLATFKAVIHLPYHWNGIANGDALSVGTPYYVPTKRFLKELIKTGKYWFQNVGDVDKWIDICDFYDVRFRDWQLYFDSWDDIKPVEADTALVFDLAERVYWDSRSRLENILKRW